MNKWLKGKGWPLAKFLLALAILLAVGKRFYDDLHDLDLESLSLNPAWLGLSAGLYLLGLGFSGLYWYHLLWIFGEKPRRGPAFRAYYIGHLGKYVPGKAWALLLRSILVKGPEVRLGVAAITAFYEVLTTMASGVLLAAGIFLIQPPGFTGLTWNPVLMGLLLLVLVMVPLLPGVFNGLVSRLAGRFQNIGSFRLPPLRHATLLAGLLTTSLGWVFLGTSLWAALQGVLPESPGLSAGIWAHCAASLGLAYVAGFLAIVVPGGVGVREFFLLQLLKPLGPEGLIALAILILRLLWTAGEVLAAGILFLLPMSKEPRSFSDRS